MIDRSQIDKSILETQLKNIDLDHRRLQDERTDMISKEEVLQSEIENLKNFHRVFEEECEELRQ